MLNNRIIRCRGKPRTRLEIQKNQSMVLLRGKDVLEGKGEKPCPSRKIMQYILQKKLIKKIKKRKENFLMKNLKNYLKEKKGITLVALVLTIIVLLILAGISLNLIMGDGGILKRATNARKTSDLAGAQEKVELLLAEYSYDYLQEKYVNGNGTFADNKATYISTKLSDYARDNDAQIAGCGLVVEETTVKISKDGKIIVGSIGQDGEMTWQGDFSGISISSTLQIREGDTVALTVTKQGEAEEKTVTWSKSGNVTFVTDSTGATEVSGQPTTDTVYVKAGALSGGTSGSVTVSAIDEESQTCNITIGGVASAQSTITTTPAYSGGTGTSSDPYVMTVQEGKTGSISVAVKDSNGSTTTADSITFASGTTSVATVTPASETNVSSSTATVSGVAENSNGSVITITIDSVTKYVKVVVSEVALDYGTAQNASTYGQTVNYTTTLNGVTLSNWKKLYENENGETYIILADYLPITAIDTTNANLTGISTSGTHVAKASSTRKQLIDAMKSSYWDALKTGTIGETAVTATSAMGSPTLELWQASWNAKYPNKAETYTTNQLYIGKTASAMSDGYKGFYVSRTNNPPTTSEYGVGMSGSEGYVYASSADALYFPHTSAYGSANGYWLASPSGDGSIRVMIVNGVSSSVGNSYYYSAGYAWRPVVCLPSSSLE